MHTYHCHNTRHTRLLLSRYKYVHLPLSQYKTYTLTTVATQDMHTYHCQNTRHAHLPLSQHKTCTLTTVTVQTCTLTIVTIQGMHTYHCHDKNIYTYHCHNTRPVHLPLSRYKTFTPTTVTIQNM
jgi:hypothetical protein